MSRSTKQASPYKKGQIEDLDHDFLVSFLEVDDEVKAAILGQDPSPGFQFEVPLPDERVQVLRSVESAEDDDILALTGLYAEIDSWSPRDVAPAAGPARRRSRTPSNRSANVTAVEIAAPKSAAAPKTAAAPKSAAAVKGAAAVKPSTSKPRTAPASTRVSVVKPTAPVKQRAAAAAVRTVEVIRAPEPVVQLNEVEKKAVVILDATRNRTAPAAGPDEPATLAPVLPLAHTPERALSFETLAAQYDVVHRETLSLPAPKKREARRPTKDLAFMAAQAQEGYNSWLATRSRYALQWDYMNFNLGPPPPGPRTMREARRIETRNMIKYYSINAHNSHARQDKKLARRILAQARRGGLQSA